MQLIKVAGAELNQTPMDWEKNLGHIIEAITQAKQADVSILCLPELCISGYGCEDMFYSPGLHRTCLQNLIQILPHTENITVLVGLPIAFQNRVFNCAALLANKKVHGFVAKRFLAGSGIHYEPRWFTPWPQGEVAGIQAPQLGSIPIGDIHFNLGGIKIGLEICEDAWVAHRPGRELYRYGVDLILNPSASHFAFGKLETRKRFVLEGSRSFGVGYVYTNLLGNEAGRAIYDGGTIIASNGELIAMSERLTFHDVRLTSALIDIDAQRMAQSQAATQFNLPHIQDAAVEVPFSFPKISPQPNPITDAKWEKSPFLQEEEFARAEVLGLYDYLRKSRSQGFVVSLSGGADSSAIVSLCYLMCLLGSESIGLDKFKSKLNYIKDIDKCESPQQIASLLITTAYQPTENSGAITRNAAAQLAAACKTQHYELDVNEVFKNYLHTIEKAIQRPLSWQTDDIALQNIQARVRAPSVWMLANLKGALLLSTSNRSEAAVGYATMDGDTSGGLSPIAGIDKAFLRKWLKWLEKEGVDGRHTLPALKYVNEQQPTAELRPPDQMQTDEADLMPYEVLDAIEEAAIRDKKMPKECLEMVVMQFPQYNYTELKCWVIRFFRLWSRNQWKRERYAPSFHLDDKNLDPKTWCRFPILSGGFEHEIKELE